MIVVASSDLGNQPPPPSPEDNCICTLLDRPARDAKEMRARWMVHSLHFGVLSTIRSTQQQQQQHGNSPTTTTPIPFGNVYSFVDGLCNTSTGIPYFYGTLMDQSFQDVQENPMVSFTLTEATLPTLCSGTRPIQACVANGYHHAAFTDPSLLSSTQNGNQNAGGGDPESPVCARLTITGRLVELHPSTTASTAAVGQEQESKSNNSGSDEYEQAKEALFQRHPYMKDWPESHHWVVAKLEIHEFWMIDYFGGPSLLSVPDYLAVDLFPPQPNSSLSSTTSSTTTTTRS